MGWLFWVLLIFTILMAIRGADKGFLRMALSLASMVIIMLLASWLNPYVGSFMKTTPVYTVVKSECGNFFEKKISSYENDEGQGMSKSDQITAIDAQEFPEIIRNALNENNNSEIYDLLGVSDFVDYLSGYVANFVINGIAYILSFAIAAIIVKLIFSAIDLLTMLPVVGTVNAIAGMLVGVGQAILWIWVFFVLVTILCNTELGQILAAQIEDNSILKILYDKNVLLNIITAVL